MRRRSITPFATRDTGDDESARMTIDDWSEIMSEGFIVRVDLENGDIAYLATSRRTPDGFKLTENRADATVWATMGDAVTMAEESGFDSPSVEPK